MGRRAAGRALATLVAAVAGAVLLSGSDQPVTAHSYPRWQALPAPPMSPRTHALGLAAGHRVLVLGGLTAGVPARDGATYDLRTGIWRSVRTPVAITDHDSAVVAAGVVILRHLGAGELPSWWRYDLRPDAWSRMRQVPPRLSVPSAFGSEVYSVSGRRVAVYSVQLRKWTVLPADLHRPRLFGVKVTASRPGIVVTGHLARRPGRVYADRWDGLRWHRNRVGRPEVAAAPDGATRVRVDGRTLVIRNGNAWIRLP